MKCKKATESIQRKIERKEERLVALRAQLGSIYLFIVYICMFLSIYEAGHAQLGIYIKYVSIFLSIYISNYEAGHAEDQAR